LLALALLSGCAAGKAFSHGEKRALAGDWDAAVVYYQQAVQHDPNNADYRIALERANLAASRAHFDTARQLEQKDQPDAALIEYKKTVDYDPGNRQAAEKVAALEKIVADRLEAARPKPQSAQVREQARIQAAQPELNPASRDAIRATFNQASLRDILTFISNASGISIIYDASFVDKPFTITMVGTLEQVLNSVLGANQMFYSVQDDHTIIVAADTNANRLKYERQSVVTFPVSYADLTELSTMITSITRTTTAAIPPVIVPNKTANTITVRATQPVMDVIRELILTNDKPRAEVTLDVEILEVSRGRAKQVGLNLSAYQAGIIFSPEQAPPGALGAISGVTGNSENRPFNLNTITQGISTADFYTSLPQAFVRFLETDTHTKVRLKTTLRGAEGSPLTLDIGAKEPYLSTTFAPIATGGPNITPTSSYTFEQVGISLQALPRVTDEGDIVIMPLGLKNSALGPSRLVGGSPAPSFTNREVKANIRLRDGESHLLAGLFQDDERKTMRGFPGVMSVKVLRDIFSDTDSTIEQTDIVMLLTPHIIRTHEYTAHDLAPLNVGTNQNLGLTGPPPLIAAPPEPQPQAAASVPAGAPQPPVPGAQPPQAALTPQAAPQATTAMPQTPQVTTLRPPVPAAQVSLSAPTGEVRVAGGPYMVTLYVTRAKRMFTPSLTVNFNPAVLRVQTVQQGSFLQQGAAPVVFTHREDATLGRVDLTFARTGDSVGASGSGLLAGVMFQAIGPGTSQLSVSGIATDTAGANLPLQFTPITVVVR